MFNTFNIATFKNTRLILNLMFLICALKMLKRKKITRINAGKPQNLDSTCNLFFKRKNDLSLFLKSFEKKRVKMLYNWSSARKLKND